MAQIPESVIEEILNKADIESVVGKYVSFTKRTGQNLFGLCPFHSEKTPSFSVSLSKNIYRCFGCQKGGNSIKFIMEIEKLSYPEAIRFLGKQYGVDVPEYSNNGNNDNLRKRKKRVTELLNEAGKYYFKCFSSPEGKPARDYAKKRELSKDTLTSFGIGYAPEGWDLLYKHLLSKGYTEEEMKDSGLFTISRKTGKPLDLFRGRMVFPIFDVFGKIIAFGGRALGDEMPKYVNSPDSLVYKKQEHLYALNYAKAARSDQLIIVEGYMDAISMHQAGITNVVASLGTAFTDSQLRLAAKFNEIVFFFDSDKAGRAAAIRAVRMMLTFLKKMAGVRIRIKIAAVPDGKDPDEYIKLNGADSFRGVVKAAKDVDDYLFSRAYDDNCAENGQLDTYKFQEDIINYGSWMFDDLKREKMATQAAPYLGANSRTILNKMNDLMMSEQTRQYEMDIRSRKKIADADMQDRLNRQNDYDYDPTQDNIPESGDSSKSLDNTNEVVNQPVSSAQPAPQKKHKGPPADLVYMEELVLFVCAMRLRERLATVVAREDVLRPDDFYGANMKGIVSFFLEHFDAKCGVREDLLLNRLSQTVFNGMPAEEVYLRTCESTRRPQSSQGEVDLYLLKLYDMRIKKLDQMEKSLTNVLNTAVGEKKESVIAALRKIDDGRAYLKNKKAAL